MSTHNICFRGEIRKILCGYPLLSVAIRQVHMLDWVFPVHTVVRDFSFNNGRYLCEYFAHLHIQYPCSNIVHSEAKFGR